MAPVTFETIERNIIGIIGALASMYVGYLGSNPIDHKVLAGAAIGFLISGIIIDADPIVGAISKLITLAKDAKSLKD